MYYIKSDSSIKEIVRYNERKWVFTWMIRRVEIFLTDVSIVLRSTDATEGVLDKLIWKINRMDQMDKV